MICSICSGKAHHKHHIISKSKCGTNDKFNLTELCSNCHYEVHRGNIIIEGKFLTSSGLKTIYHRKNEESITNQEPAVYIQGKK